MGHEGFSKVIDRQYRLTRTAGGLKIEVLDYHAEPVVLSPELLDEFGLAFRDAPAEKIEGPGRGTRSRDLPF